MKFGLADGLHTIVASAAISKYLQVINKGDNGKSQGGMTGFTGIRGSDVIAYFR